ncbi:MAG: tRNA lysidine(34) synthetase TilS [Fibrobacteria bacterium]|nr:tRNA lysidine(34) synthetase TilS [Fibrobacteria bacterium]
MDKWDSHALSYLKKKQFQPFNKTLLVAVSGGMDSISLLHFWHTTGRKTFACRILAVHIDHGLRQDSKQDRVFVQELCHSWNIPFYYKTLNPATKAKGLSWEMWGRKKRYSFFRFISNKYYANYILTAHHLNDQLETLLIRLTRGVTLKSLGCIPFFREPDIIRPFLNKTRENLLAYAKTHNLSWTEDHSNTNTAITRNWYRWNYIPNLIIKEPQALQSVHKLTSIIQELWPTIRHQLTRKLIIKNGISLLHADSIEDLLDCDFLLWEFLALFFEKNGFILSRGIFNSFIKQWKQSPQDIKICITPRKNLILQGDFIHFQSVKLEKPVKKAKYPVIEVKLLKNEKEYIHHWDWQNIAYSINIKRYAKPENYIISKKKNWKTFLDADFFTSTLLIRTRKSGDRFSPLGIASRHRKLKTYFINKKVPKIDRTQQILLCSDNEVIWIPGYEISEFYKISEKTRFILELEIKCQN